MGRDLVVAKVGGLVMAVVVENPSLWKVYLKVGRNELPLLPGVEGHGPS